MNLLSELTPISLWSDLTISEMRQIHRALGLPWWLFLAPRRIAAPRVHRAMELCKLLQELEV